MAVARPAATSAHNIPAAKRTGRLVGCRCLWQGAGGDRTEHQHAGHSADRRLRQSDIDRREPDPGDGQQQPVDDETDNGCEGFARGDRRSPDPEDQDGKNDIESRKDGHPCDPRRRTAPAMSCVTIAPDNWTSSQMLTSFSAPNGLRLWQQAQNDKAEAKIVHLGQGCRRVSESGKRSKPTVPAKKKNAPAETAKTVKMSNARFIRRSLLSMPRSRRTRF